MPKENEPRNVTEYLCIAAVLSGIGYFFAVPFIESDSTPQHLRQQNVLLRHSGQAGKLAIALVQSEQ